MKEVFQSPHYHHKITFHHYQQKYIQLHKKHHLQLLETNGHPHIRAQAHSSHHLLQRLGVSRTVTLATAFRLDVHALLVAQRCKRFSHAEKENKKERKKQLVSTSNWWSRSSGQCYMGTRAFPSTSSLWPPVQSINSTKAGAPISLGFRVNSSN